MAGLDPAIHAAGPGGGRGRPCQRMGVDARVEPGHDGAEKVRRLPPRIIVMAGLDPAIHGAGPGAGLGPADQRKGGFLYVMSS